MLVLPPEPVGCYERGCIRGQVGCVSGQFPLREGRLAYRGLLGRELSVAEGEAAARLAAMNAVGQMAWLLDSQWERLEGVVRLEGYLACAVDFDQSVQVMNAASAVLLELLGDKGQHARSLVLVERLPLEAPLELVVSFAIRAES
jgi:enamine deaminase RidA (YjgF/YER057c/UK114 family)